MNFPDISFSQVISNKIYQLQSKTFPVYSIDSEYKDINEQLSESSKMIKTKYYETQVTNK